MTDNAKKKPSWLRHLVVNKVSLVDAGSNPGASISFYKRAPEATTTNAPVSRDLDSRPKSQPVFKQQDVMGAITTLAAKEFPDDSVAVAISKYIDTPTGQALREKYAKAEPHMEQGSFEGPSTRSYDNLAGGDTAATISKMLDDRVADVVAKSDLTEHEAWDHVLASPEGIALRDKYSEVVR